MAAYFQNGLPFDASGNLCVTGATVAPSGDTSGATDAAAIQAALTAGGIVNLQAGTYYLNAKLTATAAVKIVGAGSSDAYWVDGNTAPTRLLWNTSTGDGIELQGVGSVVERVHFGNTSTTVASAGSAIILNGCHGAQIRGCSTLGFYKSLRVANCVPYTIEGNKFSGPAYACIEVDNSSNNDEGDPAIIGNWLTATGLNNATPTAALLFIRGGGVKFVGNKVNREAPALASTYWFTNAILFKPSTSVSTGVFVITGNSLENMNSNAILMDGSSGGTGSLQNFTITGNELQGTSSGAVLEISGTSTYPFRNITIGENVCTGFGGYVSAKAYCDGLNIGPIQADTFSGQALFLGQTGGIGQATSTVTNVSYDLSKINLRTWGPPKTILIDYTESATDSHSRGSQINKITREVPNLGVAVPTTTEVARITLGQYRACKVKVTFAANMSGVGAYVGVVERALTCSGANVITATTIGTDFNTATKLVDIAFDVATNNLAKINITTIAAVGLTASQPGSGQITIEIDGRLRVLERR